VLKVIPKDIDAEFVRGFEGMTHEPISVDALVAARKQLVATIIGAMPDEHRRFLVSFEQGRPEWELLGVKGVEALPAVLWRQQNLDSLDRERRSLLVDRLKDVLGIADDAP
jgi:hypothetical protein